MSTCTVVFGLVLLGAGWLSAQPIPQEPVEVQLNVFTTRWQDHPQVAATLDGFVVVWKGTDTPGGDIDRGGILARRFDLDLRALDETEFQLNTYTTENQIDPVVATEPGGGFVVAWQSYGSWGSDTDGYSIQVRRFSSDGSPVDPIELQVNTETFSWQQRPAISADSEGNFVVVWDGWLLPGDPDSYSVRARRFSASGFPRDLSEFQVNSITTDNQVYPSVAMSPDGSFVVAWNDGYGGPGNPNPTIRVRRFAADGAPIDPVEQQVNLHPDALPLRPDVAMASDGRFVVVWERLTAGQTVHDLVARRFGANGVPLDPVEVEIQTDPPDSPSRASVAMDPEGNFVVAWQGYGFDGDPDQEIVARRYRADGTPIDAAPFRVNAYTTSEQRRPHVLAHPAGDFFVVWDSNYGSFGNDSSYTSVQGRRYGRPVIEVTALGGGSGGPGCTLRDAVRAASTDAAVGGCPAGNGGGVVELPAGASIGLTGIDNGSNGLPAITRPVTVRGRGGRIERDPGLACPAGEAFRLFEVVDGGVLTLDGVAISNGCLSSQPGAGVLVGGGSLFLRRAAIEGNESGADGGGVAVVGGNLIALDSTVRGNLAGGAGGGISVSGAPGWLVLEGSTLSENTAATGGALSLASPTFARIARSTLSGNTASGSGGSLRLADPGARLLLEFATASGNAAPNGAGAFLDDGVLSLHGSLLGENPMGADCAVGAGTLEASGLSLDTDGTCAALAGSNVATVPGLGLAPLADQGGWTRTHLPLAESPALDAAPACATRSGAAVTRDQRDDPRPTDDDGDGTPECDLGAVERGPIFLDGFESGDAGRWSFSAARAG